MRNPSVSGRSVLRVGIVVVGLVALVFLVLQQVNFLVGRSLLIAFGDVESTYRRAWFEWDGDVTAQDVVVYPDGTAETALHFASAHVETPGWSWFLRNTFDRKLRMAKLDRLHLTLEGLDTTAGMDPTLGDLGPVGALSASPFEAEGCAQDGLWTRAELADMGLMPGPTTLEFDYAVQGSELVTKVSLATPGASRVQFERHEQLPKPVNALVLDTVPTMTRFERWDVIDQGFVKARNAFCAKKDGIDEATFLARHLASVQRLLQTRGLAADADAIAAYGDFARNGGQLAFGGGYVQPLHSTQLYDAHDDGSALTRMNGVLERGSRRVAVQWSRFDPRPLPADADSTWAAVQAEQGGAAGAPPAAGSAAPTAAGPSASTIPVAAGTDASTIPSVAVATAAPAAKPAETGAVTTTPDGRPLASSLPVAQLAQPGANLAWAELARYQGHVMQIWTMHNEPRTAMLLSANGGEAHVRASVEGGHAEYRIKREAFIRATLIQ